jgi:hypothetical protein
MSRDDVYGAAQDHHGQWLCAEYDKIFTRSGPGEQWNGA